MITCEIFTKVGVKGEVQDIERRVCWIIVVIAEGGGDCDV